MTRLGQLRAGPQYPGLFQGRLSKPGALNEAVEYAFIDCKQQVFECPEGSRLVARYLGKGSKAPLALHDAPRNAPDKGKSGRGKGHKGKKGKGLLHGLQKHARTAPGYCVNFQVGGCQDTGCRRRHHYAGCDKADVPNNECLCLAHLSH